MARAAELCTFFRPIAGGSGLESPSIVEIMATSPMCVDCLAKKTDIPPARIRDTFQRIRDFMAIVAETGRCGACLEVTTIYRLGDGNGSTAASPARPALTTQNEALWRFLESRRGEMFCTQCIANALLATKRIDRAVLGAEGRGAHRQYGKCASCGKERLLCGLMG
jgi:hypothetical protein